MCPFSALSKGYHRRHADCGEPANLILSAMSLDGCLEACDTRTDCKAVAYDGGASECELRNAQACFDLMSASSKAVYSKVPVAGWCPSH